MAGSKKNAGDYLIKNRALDLLSSWHPNQEFVDMNGWEPLSHEALDLVNGSEALVLTGGPAINTKMRPLVYALRDNLDEITVTITTFGVGRAASR